MHLPSVQWRSLPQGHLMLKTKNILPYSASVCFPRRVRNSSSAVIRSPRRIYAGAIMLSARTLSPSRSWRKCIYAEMIVSSNHHHSSPVPCLHRSLKWEPNMDNDPTRACSLSSLATDSAVCSQETVSVSIVREGDCGYCLWGYPLHRYMFASLF